MLTARVGQLLAEGVPAEDILVITPAWQATEDMRFRLEALSGPTATGVHVGTFHTIGHSILRKCATPSAPLTSAACSLQDKIFFPDVDSTSTQLWEGLL